MNSLLDEITEILSDEKVVIKYNDYWFYLLFDYDITLIEKVREIPRARYSAILRSWSAPLESALEVLQFANDVQAKVDASCTEPFIEAEKMYERVAASRATTSDIEVDGLGGELMPFQKAGVEYAINSKRLFIADEMGLGKTVQALATIQKLKAYPAIVICPAS